MCQRTIPQKVEMSRLQVDEGIKMLTDEQILQKATLLLEKTLNEMKPGEREHLGSWLYQNDPANLPFNDAFRGKIRHILPISQADNETETGKFVNKSRFNSYWAIRREP